MAIPYFVSLKNPSKSHCIVLLLEDMFLPKTSIILMPDKANHTFVQYSSYNCWSKDDSKLCEETNGNKTGDWMYFNKTCMTYEDFCGMNNYTSSGDHCVSANGTNVTVDGLHFNFKTPSEDFWNTNILGLNVTVISHFSINGQVAKCYLWAFGLLYYSAGFRRTRTCGQHLVGMG